MSLDSTENKDEFTVLIEADIAKHKQPESRGAELIKKIILICLGCFFAYKSISSFSGAFRSQAEAAIAVISAAVWGIGAGLCFAHQFLGKIGQWFGDLIYMPSTGGREAAETLSPIKGLISAEEFSEAVVKLDAVLERKPFEPEPYLMLIEIYLEHLEQPGKVVDMIEQYFENLSLSCCGSNRKKNTMAIQNVEMLMIYSDTCQELGKLQNAIDLLSQEVVRKSYSAPDKNTLTKRLNVMQGTDETVSSSSSANS
jgi:hypothetical protein